MTNTNITPLGPTVSLQIGATGYPPNHLPRLGIRPGQGVAEWSAWQPRGSPCCGVLPCGIWDVFIHLSIYLFIYLSIYLSVYLAILCIPVVPHKAVAEVSDEETYRRGWLLWIRDGRANPLIDRKVVGVVCVGVVAMVAVVTSPTTAGCSVVCCSCSRSCRVVEL